jgi:hypothetical protein
MQKMAAQNDRKEFKNNLVKHKTNTPWEKNKDI